MPIESVIAQVDVAYLDGTFFSADELPGRSMSEIPHPLIVESMARFAVLPERERGKIRFLHLNQSNPALRDSRLVKGFAVAVEGERFAL
jgi:pyrroloquinoline quinone biosynthesis protein B